MQLKLPKRTLKPRLTGRTQLIDKGLGKDAVAQYLSISSPYVDLVKLGWGTSIVTPNINEKLEVYRKYEIDVCLGGTLFELCYVQGKVDEYIAWMKDLGLTYIEISDGVIEFSNDDKLRLIEKLAKNFKVFSEVGCKDASVVMSPQKWVSSIRSEMKAGASYVILEGRESGTAGMYRSNGEIRMGLIEDIIDSGLSLDSVIFEAPQKAQQIWLITKFGSNVNMGNISFEEVISLETLRLGLRADTLKHFHVENRI
jgi:phosphosulfolactate synthase